MAAQSASSIDDAVPVRPEDLRVVVPVAHTPSACAGAATAFVLRRIAYRAGAYAPGIQEFLFHDLTTPSAGRSLATVNGWMMTHNGDLHAMGYRVSGRRVIGERTDAILAWVREGKGFRGAVLQTEYRRLHPAEETDLEHAVAIALDRVDPKGAEELVMVDPWPGTKNGARDRAAIPANLDLAHRPAKYAAMIFYWAGWS